MTYRALLFVLFLGISTLTCIGQIDQDPVSGNPYVVIDQLLRELKEKTAVYDREVEKLNRQLLRKSAELNSVLEDREKYIKALHQLNQLVAELQSYKAANDSIQNAVTKLTDSLQITNFQKDAYQKEAEALNDKIQEMLLNHERIQRVAYERISAQEKQLLEFQSIIHTQDKTLTKELRKKFQINFNVGYGRVLNRNGKPTGRLNITGDPRNPTVTFNDNEIIASVAPFFPGNLSFEFDESAITQARQKDLIWLPQDLDPNPDFTQRIRSQALFGGNNQEFYTHFFLNLRYFPKDWIGVNLSLGAGVYNHSTVVTYENTNLLPQNP